MTDAPPGNVFALFDRWARVKPQAPFITEENGVVTTYGIFERLSARIADGLARNGVRRGERVATALPKSALALALHFACLRSGVVAVPLNPERPKADALRIVIDAHCRAIVCEPGFQLRGDDLPPRVGRLSIDEAGGGELLRDAPRQPDCRGWLDLPEDALAAIIYTSGSTGQPKGVMLTHRALLDNVTILAPVLACVEDDVFLHALPLFHSHGLTLAINCVTQAGGQFLLMRRFDAAKVALALPRATMFSGVPTMYARLVAEPGFDAASCRSLRLCMCSSASLAQEIAVRFSAQTGHGLLEIYGLTETGTIAAMRHGQPAPLAGLQPLDTVEIRVEGGFADQGGADATGPLFVRKPRMAAGYWLNGGACPLPMKDGYYETGDIARLNADGSFDIVGRSSDVIHSGGYKIFPKEVELVVGAAANVRECAVFGAPHPDLGEVVVAAVVLKSGCPADGLADHVGRNLETYKTPRRYIFLDDIPLNPSGKPDMVRLRESVGLS